MSLQHFQFIPQNRITFTDWVPNRWGIFYYGPDIGLIALCLDITMKWFDIPLQEPSSLIRFLYNGIHVISMITFCESIFQDISPRQLHFWIYAHSGVFRLVNFTIEYMLIQVCFASSTSLLNICSFRCVSPRQLHYWIYAHSGVFRLVNFTIEYMLIQVCFASSTSLLNICSFRCVSPRQLHYWIYAHSGVFRLVNFTIEYMLIQVCFASSTSLLNICSFRCVSLRQHTWMSIYSIVKLARRNTPEWAYIQ